MKWEDAFSLYTGPTNDPQSQNPVLSPCACVNIHTAPPPNSMLYCVFYPTQFAHGFLGYSTEILHENFSVRENHDALQRISVLRFKVPLLGIPLAPGMPEVGHQFSNWTKELWLSWKPNRELMSTSRVAAQEGRGGRCSWEPWEVTSAH